MKRKEHDTTSYDTTKLNGPAVPRKLLSEQLDRLDGILDALDAGLDEVVADAVRKAVAVAVNETAAAVVRELLGNPEVIRAVALAHAPQAQPAPSDQHQQQAAAAQPTQKPLGPRLGRRRAVFRDVPPALGWARRACQLVWRHRIAAAGSLAAGLGAGVLSYLSGPAVSSAALAACAAAGFAALPFTDLWPRLTGSRTP